MVENPGSEEERLRALASYGIVDTPPEFAFDEITRLAALLLGVPSAAISVVDEQRQWFKARTGIDFQETPREHAFCAHAVEARQFFEVTDAADDVRFAKNPLVTRENGIRFYAGAPMFDAAGYCLGTVCVFDTSPRAPLSSSQRQALGDLAQLAVERIQERLSRIEGEVAASVVTATSDAVLAVGNDCRITFWNPGAERMFGYDAAEAIGQSLDLILPGGEFAMPPPGGPTTPGSEDKALPIGTTVELEAHRASGERFPIELSIARWNGEGQDGKEGFAAIIRDVTDRKSLEQDRASTRAFLDTIIEQLPAMLFVKDSVTRRYLLLNKVGEEVIGRPASEVIGRTDRELFPDVGKGYYDRDTSVLNSDDVEFSESAFTNDDGRHVMLRTKRLVVDAPGSEKKFILGLSEDVTDLRRNERRAFKLAHYDSLTGLFNLKSFVSRMERLIVEKAAFAVLMIDLDRFKAVNDQFGHLIGDQLLLEVGNRLRSLVDIEDVIARIGGDEFAIIVVGRDAAMRARRVASAVVEALYHPYTIDRFEAHTSACIGIVVSPRDGQTVDGLRQAADLALYQAKEIGRGKISFFSADLDEAAADRRSIESELRKAIDSRRIEVAYQPVVSTSTGRISSCEALARWTHPDRGPIGPDVFISIAEECGLIGELGAQVLESACTTATMWREDIRVAVNLSPMQFENPGLVGQISDILEKTGLAPNRLQLEVTEGLVIRDVENTFRLLAELRALGIQILMDDFGVGYSALSYLERFPFDKVKIDRSFIDKISTSPAARAVIEAVVGLGKALGMGIVAEGVETEAQMKLLTDLGCTHLQGYFFSAPKPAAALDYLSAQAPDQRFLREIS